MADVDGIEDAEFGLERGGPEFDMMPGGYRT
jgi:hypothetical protein